MPARAGGLNASMRVRGFWEEIRTHRRTIRPPRVTERGNAASGEGLRDRLRLDRPRRFLGRCLRAGSAPAPSWAPGARSRNATRRAWHPRRQSEPRFAWPPCYRDRGESASPATFDAEVRAGRARAAGRVRGLCLDAPAGTPTISFATLPP